MNADVDALSHIPWKDHDRHIEADTVQVLISNATQGTTLTEVCSCKIKVTETLDMQKYWIITQRQDPAIREIKYLISKNKQRV